ncbi:MAG: hypothetical protein RIG84_11275 [Roseovarius sp.]
MDYIERAREKYGEESRETGRKARSGRARAWARRVLMALVVLSLYAIWQDRALAPPVHDWMQETAVAAHGLIEGEDSLSGIWRPSGPAASGIRSPDEYNAITRWLLKWTS